MPDAVALDDETVADQQVDPPSLEHGHLLPHAHPAPLEVPTHPGLGPGARERADPTDRTPSTGGCLGEQEVDLRGDEQPALEGRFEEHRSGVGIEAGEGVGEGHLQRQHRLVIRPAANHRTMPRDDPVMLPPRGAAGSLVHVGTEVRRPQPEDPRGRETGQAIAPEERTGHVVRGLGGAEPAAAVSAQRPVGDEALLPVPGDAGPSQVGGGPDVQASAERGARIHSRSVPGSRSRRGRQARDVDGAAWGGTAGPCRKGTPAARRGAQRRGVPVESRFC